MKHQKLCAKLCTNLISHVNVFFFSSFFGLSVSVPAAGCEFSLLEMTITAVISMDDDSHRVTDKDKKKTKLVKVENVGSKRLLRLKLLDSNGDALPRVGSTCSNLFILFLQDKKHSVRSFLFRFHHLSLVRNPPTQNDTC